ncbi:catalase family protein, partial [Xanthomonas sp. Kuri4-2]
MSQPLPSHPVVYQPAHEQPEDDEAQTIAELEELFVGMARTVAETEGHAHRAVHAKGQGLLRAELEVLGGLPPELAQGLFARPARYDALVRLSSPPAEQLPDSVSTPRAMALKVLGVEGERVAGSEEQHSQDFLMVNGPVFVRPGPKGFLRDSKLLAMTTEKMPRTKSVISAVLRGTEAALEAVGGESSKLKTMGGQPQVHPLGETFFSQVPFLYGPYMAKFSLAPVSPALTDLTGEKLDGGDEDAQREAVGTFFAGLAAPVEWELRVQLCTDVEQMPIEDASVEWPQSLSPYRAVARLRIAAQASWDQGLSPQREDELAFAPWHALAAHRPLGALNRARKVVMAASRQFRSGFNRCPIH